VRDASVVVFAFEVCAAVEGGFELEVEDGVEEAFEDEDEVDVGLEVAVEVELGGAFAAGRAVAAGAAVADGLALVLGVVPFLASSPEMVMRWTFSSSRRGGELPSAEPVACIAATWTRSIRAGAMFGKMMAGHRVVKGPDAARARRLRPWAVRQLGPLALRARSRYV
jgi:hypothetical protein